MSSNRPYLLERIQYWHGQMLGAGDLRAQQTTEEQLRWWHNRALHGSYGIRFGLSTSQIAGPKGELTLLVACGLAYDCLGRELIVPQPRRITVPVPPPEDARSRTLLLLYRPGADTFSCCEGPAEPCWPPSCAHVLRDVALEWRIMGHSVPGDGVPLACFKNIQNDFVPDPDFHPPGARPLARPRLASGHTIPGNTPWEVWYEYFPGKQGVRPRAVGMQTRIDTSAAGFTSMPCYFAQLMGPLWNRGTGVYIPAFFPSIAEATTSGFTFRLLMRGIPRQQVTEIQPESAPAVERIAKESNASRIASIAELARVQRVVRLAKEANLRPGDQLLISATGGASGEIEPQFALVAGVDTKENLATLQFDAAGSPPQLANEFSAFTVFNPGFVTFFTAFARRQKLHVCWLGCQSEMRRPAECPGVIPIPSPCDPILS